MPPNLKTYNYYKQILKFNDREKELLSMDLIMKIKGMLLFFCLIILSSASFASLDSTYTVDWLEEDKNVFVLQQKEFTKSRQFLFDFGYIVGSPSAYQSTKGIGTNLGYFLNDNWNLSVGYHKYFNSNNTDLEILLKRDTEPFIRRIQSIMSFMVNWAPFYGKLNVFNSIVYFDWILGAGYSQIAAEHNKTSFEDNSKRLVFQSETLNALTLRSSFIIFFTDLISLNVHVNHYSYQAPVPGAGDELYSQKELALNLGFRY